MIRVIIVFILLVMLFIYVLGGASGLFDYDLLSLFKKDEWIGFFYENKESKQFIKSNPYQRSDECLKWAHRMANDLNLIEDTYKFECGKNCRFSQDYSSYFCETIVK